MIKDLHLIGYASGLAGTDVRCGEGPQIIAQAEYLQGNKWHMISSEADYPATAHSIYDLATSLAQTVVALMQSQQRFCVIGGDHTAAIGTWSGVHEVIHQQGELGLIWIDAHMDSHTPETTESGRLHGMPLAVLLGHGSSLLTELMQTTAKVRPENLCLVGVRSFEKSEAGLLQSLGVKIYYMDEVKQRGLSAVMQEALQHVTRHTIGFGVSLDLDGIDPVEAPGVDVPEPDGLHTLDLLESLAEITQHAKFLTAEIVEFDPSKDRNKLTENLILKLIRAIYDDQN